MGLMGVKGKAELIRGDIVVYPPMRWLQAEIQMEILAALHAYADRQTSVVRSG